jgi:AraC-like DNA-binding protein
MAPALATSDGTVVFSIALCQSQAKMADQIAAALSYSEASAFTRAFRRWSGQTPTSWRVMASHE